jgi:hypothetical protein
MTTYNQLHYNVDQWYDSVNDVFECLKPDEFGTHPHWYRYLYTYLSCIEEFSNDHE